VQQGVVNSMQLVLGQDDATQPPPLEPLLLVEPPPEVDEPPVQVPMELHVWLVCVQSVHIPPAKPQATSTPIWQLPL
jgi:hypothetical protein